MCEVSIVEAVPFLWTGYIILVFGPRCGVAKHIFLLGPPLFKRIILKFFVWQGKKENSGLLKIRGLRENKAIGLYFSGVSSSEGRKEC